MVGGILATRSANGYAASLATNIVGIYTTSIVGSGVSSDSPQIISPGIDDIRSLAITHVCACAISVGGSGGSHGSVGGHWS